MKLFAKCAFVALLSLPNKPVMQPLQIQFPLKEETYGLMGMRYEWKTKIINGRAYKRLFNVTTGEWIGNWIPV